MSADAVPAPLQTRVTAWWGGQVLCVCGAGQQVLLVFEARPAPLRTPHSTPNCTPNSTSNSTSGAYACALYSQRLGLRRVQQGSALALLSALLRAETLQPAAAQDGVLNNVAQALLACVERQSQPSAARVGNVLERAPDTQDRVQSLLPLVRDVRIARALQLLAQQPARAWTVATLAREVGLSRANLVRLFQRQTGTSPVRFLTHYRLETAARLLRDGDASLAEIAGCVGYESEFAFSRAFKRQHGVAPGVYRRQHAPGRVLACAA